MRWRHGGLGLLLCALQACSAVNYYAELGIRRSATAAEIKSAYREQAKRNHPDKTRDVAAQEKFQRIAAAYEVLSDPETRSQYDMYGEDFKRLAQQQELQRRHNPFQRRGKSRGPPIFSETLSLTSENHADLTEETGETWLLQFYHDWSEPCKEFSAKWEALAHKLPPMVRLARVNIDSNFGLVQRYRAFLHCRQTAFSLGLECSAPALILVTPTEEGGGSHTGEAYHGPMQAEDVYEWLKRSFATNRPSAIRGVHPTQQQISAFLGETPAARGRRRSASTGAAKLPRSVQTGPKVLVLSASRAAADTLFARYIGSRFRHLDLGALHVSGGLEGGSPAADFAKRAGVIELPALAVYPDGPDTATPIVLGVGVSSDTAQREALLASLEKLAVASVPALSAANYFETCNGPPPAAGSARAACVLLVVPTGAQWSDATSHAYEQLRALALRQESGEGVGFAWLDAGRHTAFAARLRGLAGAPAAAPAVVALRAARASTGLRSVQTARLAGDMSQLREAALAQWVQGLQGRAGGWEGAREMPPLGGPRPPGAGARLSAWFVHGGWLVVFVLLVGIFLLVYLGDDIIKWATKTQQAQKKQQQKPPQPQRPQPQPTPQPPAGESSQQRPAPTAPPAGGSSRDGVPGVVSLTEGNLAAVLAGSSFVLLFSTNAGLADGLTMAALMRHFAERSRDGSDGLRQWTLAVLDVSAALQVKDKDPLLKAVLGTLRASPCAVVRQAKKFCAYAGPASPWKVDDWLGRLTMGELAWERLGEAED